MTVRIHYLMHISRNICTNSDEYPCKILKKKPQTHPFPGIQARRKKIGGLQRIDYLKMVIMAVMTLWRRLSPIDWLAIHVNTAQMVDLKV